MALSNFFFSTKKVSETNLGGSASVGTGSFVNNYVTEALFNDVSNTLTLNRQGLPSISVNLGSISAGGTLDSVTTAGNTTSNIIEVGGATTTGRFLTGQGTQAEPSFSFGDGDTGFYEGSDDVIRVSLGNNFVYEFNSVYLTGKGVGSFAAMRFRGGNTQPEYSWVGDSNTGMSFIGGDTFCMVTGGVEIMRFTPLQQVLIGTQSAQGTEKFNVNGNFVLTGDTDQTGNYATTGSMSVGGDATFNADVYGGDFYSRSGSDLRMITGSASDTFQVRPNNALSMEVTNALTEIHTDTTIDGSITIPSSGDIKLATLDSVMRISGAPSSGFGAEVSGHIELYGATHPTKPAAAIIQAGIEIILDSDVEITQTLSVDGNGGFSIGLDSTNNRIEYASGSFYHYLANGTSLATVYGADGTQPSHFVTKSQLDAAIGVNAGTLQEVTDAGASTTNTITISRTTSPSTEEFMRMIGDSTWAFRTVNAGANSVLQLADLTDGGTLSFKGGALTATGIIETSDRLVVGGEIVSPSSAKLQVDGFLRARDVYIHEPSGTTGAKLSNLSNDLYWNNNVIMSASGVHTGNGSLLTNLNATNISSGTIDPDRLPFADNSSEWDDAYEDKINSTSFNTSTGVLTFNQQDGGALTVNLDGRYSTTDTNNYLSSASFDTASGTLTMARSGLSDITVDLDGRYLTSSTDVYGTGFSFNDTSGALVMTRNGSTPISVNLDGRYQIADGIVGGNIVTFTSPSGSLMRSNGFTVDVSATYIISGLVWLDLTNNSNTSLRYWLNTTTDSNSLGTNNRLPQFTQSVGVPDNFNNSSFVPLVVRVTAYLYSGTTYYFWADGDSSASPVRSVFAQDGGLGSPISYVNVEGRI